MGYWSFNPAIKVMTYTPTYGYSPEKGEKKIMAAMKENTKKVITYLQGLNATDNVTAQDVADALGLEKRSVDGIFTSAIQRKQFGVREEAEIELEDGTHKKVKFLKLTDAGRAIDVNAEPDAE